ncbi:MAG: ParB/RepB/Spo0J family partition protein [Bacteroidales bacterium]|nr:ParB/RepB/Spo0J family partition protein [Bacteroidales bacterium]
MAKQKSGGLGRGLGSILIDADLTHGRPVADTISMVALDSIVANPYQPRKEFDGEALAELAQSIKQQGLITPITVRQMEDGRYQLIAGERRFRASQIAGLGEVPAYIRAVTDTQMMEMALVENIQRENLNAMEVALAYKALVEECSLTHEELSEKVGKSRSSITNYLRLLNLPAETQLALSKEEISMAHARALINVEDTDRHLELLHAIKEKHLSVREVEQMVKAEKERPQPRVKKKGELPASHVAAREGLRNYLQSVVEVKRTQRGKGTLTISFTSDKDFERIVALLEGSKAAE